jgi:membrane-bound lytic murein transglycosylase D
MKLKIPGGDSSSAREVAKSKVHVVRKGDNLTEIAAKYNVTVGQLKQNNRKLRNPASLMVGTRIHIPIAEAN